MGLRHLTPNASSPCRAPLRSCSCLDAVLTYRAVAGVLSRNRLVVDRNRRYVRSFLKLTLLLKIWPGKTQGCQAESSLSRLLRLTYRRFLSTAEGFSVSSICLRRGVLVTKWQRWGAPGCSSNDAVARWHRRKVRSMRAGADGQIRRKDAICARESDSATARATCIWRATSIGARATASAWW